ncbi:MAG: putative oxidoreductase [Parcubacteria group bacterium Gr01-1014_56]|nr:MAG: putative oxidoreductase [Parcubacteria group bacterium Gr01-1014_56]
MSSLKADLRKVMRGETEDDAALLEKCSRDASLFKVLPELIVYPTDASDVASVVRFVARKKQVPKVHLSITARAAGTDMSGGPLNDSIILDTTKHLNHFLELGKDFAVVEPGMYFRDFDKQTKKKDLELPSYTASRELCTVGGMVANNSGGEKNLKYGKTARYVKELEVVLSDGQTHTLREYKGDALTHKLTEDSFEGEIYRKVAALVSTPEHQRVIQEHKPKVEKNSSGYALWDIGDGKSGLNLARLMVGSQGTLGIVTKIKFGLVRPKPYAAMTIMFLDSLSELGEVVPLVLKHSPDSFESYDDHTFKLAVKYFPEFAVQMKSGLISLGLSFLPEVWMLLTGGIPKLVLMAEFRAESQKAACIAAEILAEEIKKSVSPKGGRSHIKVRVAKSEAAARKYWVIRRESFNLLRKKIRGKRTAPFIDDFVVPPRVLPEFLPKLEEILSHYDLTYTIAGHVGDGNFHIIPLVDPTRADTARIIDELSHKVYDLVISYQGSISGEHNDGLIRTPYVEKMFGREMYALFMEIKKIFDPHNIFNPGKKVGGNFGTSIAHLDLPGIKSTTKSEIKK